MNESDLEWIKKRHSIKRKALIEHSKKKNDKIMQTKERENEKVIRSNEEMNYVVWKLDNYRKYESNR